MNIESMTIREGVLLRVTYGSKFCCKAVQIQTDKFLRANRVFLSCQSPTKTQQHLTLCSAAGKGTETKTKTVVLTAPGSYTTLITDLPGPPY
jgi:hypothetical protein